MFTMFNMCILCLQVTYLDNTRRFYMLDDGDTAFNFGQYKHAKLAFVADEDTRYVVRIQ
jgi:hypothetical protein